MQSVAERADQAGSIVDRLLNIVPTNPVEALATGNILQIIFFAIMFGVGILMAGKIAEPVAKWFDGASEAMMKVTIIVMETAPIGVFALMTTVMATQGLGVLQSLGTLAFALYLACAIHIVVTYGGIIIKGVLGLPFIPFMRGITDAQAVAYSTASSSATLPVTITCAEENLGIDKAVAGSVLPLGATINMDGTAIYIGMVALFGAQAMGVEVSLAQYVLVAVMATLVSIGAAGIPSAGLFLSGLALAQVGIPEEQAFLIIGFILPFDRLLDMMRTLTNVTGDTAVATAVAKWEGELDEEVFRARDNLSSHIDDRDAPAAS
jgi:Na+/H+-dicarboxylate symporter